MDEDKKKKCEECGQYFMEYGMHVCFERKWGNPYEYYEQSFPAGVKRLYTGKWTCLMSNDGWEYVARKNNEPVVSCIAIYKDDLILVKQFRKPLNRHVIEFPAGVIDKGETPEETIIRELREETGFDGKIEKMLPTTCKSAGITNEILHVAIMKCEHPPKSQDLQGDENIEVICLNTKNEDIQSFINKEEKQGVMFDSNVRLYLELLQTLKKIIK